MRFGERSGNYNSQQYNRLNVFSLYKVVYVSWASCFKLTEGYPRDFHRVLFTGMESENLSKTVDRPDSPSSKGTTALAGDLYWEGSW